MKKILSVLLCTMLAMTMFTACTSEPVTESTADTESSATESSATEESSAEESETEGDAENMELNLYSWAGMFPDELLNAFTEETGIKINYSTFDSNETMLSKLQTNDGGGYDLIISDDYIIETAIAEGLVQKLDMSKITNIDNVNPAYQGLFFDPTNEYTVPHGAGVITLVYDPTLVDIEIDSYADLWDPSLENNVGIIGNYRIINGVALKVNGETMNTEDTAAITAAGDKLLELAPNIRLIKNENLQEDLLSGEVGVALMYTSQATLAMIANPDLEVAFPSEGTGFGVMAQYIPVNAPNPDAAHAFIDFLLEAENGKQAFEWLGYYSTNTAADELIADEYKSFLTLPAEFDISTLEIIHNISVEADGEHNKIWTAFRAETE